MSISDEGWSAICAYEAGDRAEVRAIREARRMMVVHLHKHHGMGEKKIAQELGVDRYRFVRPVLKAIKEQT